MLCSDGPRIRASAVNRWVGALTFGRLQQLPDFIGGEIPCPPFRFCLVKSFPLWLRERLPIERRRGNHSIGDTERENHLHAGNLIPQGDGAASFRQRCAQPAEVFRPKRCDRRCPPEPINHALAGAVVLAECPGSDFTRYPRPFLLIEERVDHVPDRDLARVILRRLPAGKQSSFCSSQSFSARSPRVSADTLPKVSELPFNLFAPPARAVRKQREIWMRLFDFARSARACSMRHVSTSHTGD